MTNPEVLERRTSLLSLPVRGFAAVVLGATMLSACGDETDPDEGPPACDEVITLERDDLNGGQTIAAGCYEVHRTISVNDGNLVLEPGVLITFSQGVGLAIEGNGSLTAEGTEDAPIYLLGAEERRGFWMGLYFNGSNSPNNKLDHVVLSHAGSSGWHGGGVSRGGIFIRENNNQLHITNSKLTHHAQAAIVADGGGIDFKVENVEFNDNEMPLWLNQNLVSNLKDLRFSDNEKSHILIGAASRESVAEARTWRAFDVPYRARIHISPKATLTLDPGVTIEFEQNYGFEITGEGRLKAEGTEEEKILLTGSQKQRGFWKGLYYHQTRSSDNVLDHVIVEYAGSEGWHGGPSRGGIFTYGDGVALKVSNSLFRENAAAGIYVDHGVSDVSVASTAFEDNELPIWFPANLVGKLADDNTFKDNDKSWILIGRIQGASDATGIRQSQTWLNLPIPYRTEATVNVRDGADLTIAPGTTLEFKQDTGIEVNGTLSADATDDDRISFIAADGETLQGYWMGIYFQNSASSKNVIANADILSAGSKGWHGGGESRAGIFLYENSAVALSDVNIARSGKYGLSVNAKSRIESCSDLTFSENLDSDLNGNTGACL